MQQRTRPLWSAGIVAITLILAAGCGGPARTAAGPPASSSPNADVHSGHSAEPLPSPDPLRADERFQTVTMPQAYTPTAPSGGTDEYRCFIIDPKLTSGAYLTGSQFLPQNTAIVHHAIIFQINPTDAASARQLDAQTPGEGWTCFGDAGIGGQQAWVASWAPGTTETLLDPHLGYSLPPGSLLVMQVHYNLLATGGKAGGRDQSSLRLRLHPATSSMVSLQTLRLEAPIELPCTAKESGALCDRSVAVADVAKRFGDQVGGIENELVSFCDRGRPPTAGTTQSCDWPVRSTGTVYAMGGHMHLLGRSIRVELNPGTPGARTLLDVPHYNFDNQRVLALGSPLTLKRGDVLRVTCQHDAGLRAQLPALRGIAPRYVVWGDGTSDEMCLGLVVWAPAAG